ncbi:coagulation factor VIII-like [Patiria miniata]|uniref:F5/8 type C domain-containing protein n=1 Tax=Patiria miniata TaxID=46514 RepID=A0A914A9P5_PATMI|nr:coagulation factor VIII-like [Patiria miniata]
MDKAAALVLMLSAMAVAVSCHQVCFIGSEYNPQSGIPPRWFLPYKDPCECTAVRLGGMSIPAYRMGAPYYLNELFLSEDSYEIQAYFDCEPAENNPEGCSSPQPLGMEDGTIQDDHITASSSRDCCPASDGRLNDDGWIAKIRILTSFNHCVRFSNPFQNRICGLLLFHCSSSSLPSVYSYDTNPWIEVDLDEPTVVTGVTTQGYSVHVKKYKVSYKKQPSSDYEHVTDGNGNITVFIGNTDADTPVTNLFDESVLATVVRIEPTEWDFTVGLRLELLGCRRD